MKISPERSAWNHMIQRCTNPKDLKFESYGARGITIYPEWRKSFKAFLEYVGPRPSPKHSLDRYPNNDGNYEPGNVRWATANQQARNTRQTRFLSMDGEKKSVVDWAGEFKRDVNALKTRIKKGIPTEIALAAEPDSLQGIKDTKKYMRALVQNGRPDFVLAVAEDVASEINAVVFTAEQFTENDSHHL